MITSTETTSPENYPLTVSKSLTQKEFVKYGDLQTTNSRETKLLGLPPKQAAYHLSVVFNLQVLSYWSLT